MTLPDRIPVASPATRQFLELATVHLTPATQGWLTTVGRKIAHGDAFYSHWVGITPYGWVIFADLDPEIDLPDLRAAVDRARALGAEYILFDCDAPADPELAIHPQEDDL